MSKSYESSKSTAVWFGIVDILIILILAGFLCSLFLVDETGTADDADAEKLSFAVSVQAPYSEALFWQEGRGNPIALRFEETETPFGWLHRGEDGSYYVECALSAVRASEDLKGLWYLEDTVLLTGTTLSVQSELANFSVTILTLPKTVHPGASAEKEPAS